jgi:hypothetical protein
MKKMEQKNTQSYEDVFYTEYKKIRNKFRNFNPYQSFFACIDYLHYPVKDKIEELQKHPWFVFLLLKWIFSDEQFSAYNKKDINKIAFTSVLQMMRDLGAIIRMPSEYYHHTLFFRNIAYQQFIYQLDFNIASIARQQILFDDKTNNRFNNDFEKATAISINDFLEISILILTRFVDTTNYDTISIAWFGELRKAYKDDTINKYLSLISLEVHQLHEFFIEEDLNKKKKKIHEFYEQTPLLKYPLIKINDNYICMYKNLLFRSIEHFIYDKLKFLNPENFMTSFGHIFEKYVEKGLSYANVEFITEKEILKDFPDNRKVIDFVINEKTATIYIDAKAVEMTYLGKVTHDPDIISDKVKDTIIKAIEQAFETANRPILFQSSNDSKENFLLVITYKELYLGNGTNFYETIAKNRIDKIINNYSNQKIIPLENIYFITIDEFDYLIELVNKKKISFLEILQYAKEADKDEFSTRFDFHQHLKGLNQKLYLPEFLNQANKNIIENISKKMNKESN